MKKIAVAMIYCLCYIIGMTGDEAKAALKRLGISQRALALAIHRAEGERFKPEAVVNRINREISGDRLGGELVLLIRLLDKLEDAKEVVTAPSDANPK